MSRRRGRGKESFLTEFRDPELLKKALDSALEIEAIGEAYKRDHPGRSASIELATKFFEADLLLEVEEIKPEEIVFEEKELQLSRSESLIRRFRRWIGLGER